MNIPRSYEFDGHRLIAHFHDPEIGLDAVICLHRGNAQIPAFGATRVIQYKNYPEALDDALRLSRLMSYKSAMAGLKYGGGKGVIILHGKLKGAARQRLLEKYVSYVNYLAGHFITGADMGLTNSDVSFMKSKSPYIVGTKSDPVKYTALGIYKCLGVCLKEVVGSDDLSRATFAIEGLGKIGESLLSLIYKKAKKIYAADISRDRLRFIKKYYPKVELVNPKELLLQKTDVFAPCAVNGTINLRSINKINCKVVLGGANNQLDQVKTGEKLHKMGIFYAPDYIVNAGGLISVVDEYEHKGNFKQERVIKRINHISDTLTKIISLSKKQQKPPFLVADEMARKIFNAR